MKKLILITLSLFAMNAHGQDAAAPAEEKPLKVEAEVGIVSSEGNTKSSSYLLKEVTSYRFDTYAVKFNGSYLSNESRDNDTDETTSYEKWDLGIRLERDITQKISAFIGQNMESDKKAGVDRKYNTDIGGKYYIAKSEGYYTFAEAGYRLTKEEYVAGGNEDFNFLRAYIESEKKWTPTFSSKFWIEYLPNLDESEDYNLNGEASINAAINTSFSVKTAYLVKYDNVPAAEYRTDSLFSTSLIAKF